MLRLTSIFIAALSAAWGLAAPVVADIVGVEDFMRSPAAHDPQISPDGSMIASIQPIDGRGSIVLSTLAGAPDRILRRDPDRSIGGAQWSRDGRWLLYLQDNGGDEAFQLFRVDPKGNSAEVKNLTPFKSVIAELISLPAQEPSIAIIVLNKRNPALTDAYRLNLDTGALEIVAENDGHMTGYFADGRGNILLTTAIRDTGALEVLARGGDKSPWRRIYSAPPNEQFSVQQLSPDGKAAVVRSNRIGSFEELYWMSLSSGDLSPLGPHKCGSFDAGEAILDDAGSELAQTCVEENATIVPRSPIAARAISALGPQGRNTTLVSRSADASRWVFEVNASDDPGRYLLYDDRTQKVRTIFVRRPWLDGAPLAKSQPFWIKARDGLPLLTYLTMPPKPAKGRPPLLVLVHGGPWTRDTSEFSGDTQIWANRGYAVLQVNFRGSTGLGKRHFEAGVGQFGGAMVDDIVDAVRWAIAEKRVSDEVCVAGGSYGGYATLVALTRYPEIFACGIDYAGPVDLVSLVSAFPPDWKPYLPRSWYRFVGDPNVPEQRRAMEKQSPINSIDQARAPLFIFQGANDPRVTRSQSDAIARAFCNKGLSVTYLVAENEGHSFGNEETALAVTRGAEIFLGRVLGGRVEATVKPTITETLGRMLIKEPCGAK